ncbi:MAG: hypothetical protein GY835_10205 [bacterium]|nr:hypothetical protein [bacterium]
MEPTRDNRPWLFKSGFAFVVVIVSAALTLVTLSYFRLDSLVWFMPVIFLIWDTVFFRSAEMTEDRGPHEFIGQLRAARGTMLAFMAFYAVLIGSVLTLDVDKYQQLRALFEKADLPPYLLIVPLVIASVGSLYLPVVWRAPGATDHAQGVSAAMRALIGNAMLCEKIVVYIFTYLVLRLMWAFLL